MAIKVAFSAALLVALIAVASAATITTTVITNSHDDEEFESQSRCRRQLQGRQLRDCQSYLTQQQYLEMATENPQRERAAEACCQSLRAIEQQQQQCGCEAVRHALKQVQEGGQMRRSEQVYQKAKMLPRVCGLRTQQCRLNVVFF